MANEPRFEIYPMQRRVESAWAEDPIRGRHELPGRREPTGEYGWRFRAANGHITAVGGEGFTRRQDARRAASEFLATIAEGAVLMIDTED